MSVNAADTALAPRPHAIGEALRISILCCLATVGAGALAAATLLANHLDCERVSFGEIRSGKARVVAISDTPRIDRREAADASRPSPTRRSVAFGSWSA